jgi:hypothetical protein
MMERDVLSPELTAVGVEGTGIPADPATFAQRAWATVQAHAAQTIAETNLALKAPMPKAARLQILGLQKALEPNLGEMPREFGVAAGAVHQELLTNESREQSLREPGVPQPENAGVGEPVD